MLKMFYWLSKLWQVQLWLPISKLVIHTSLSIGVEPFLLRRDYSIGCEYLLFYVWAACLIKHQKSEQQVRKGTQKVCLPPGTNASTFYHLCLFPYLPFITMIFWAWYLSDCPRSMNEYSKSLKNWMIIQEDAVVTGWPQKNDAALITVWSMCLYKPLVADTCLLGLTCFLFYNLKNIITLLLILAYLKIK